MLNQVRTLLCGEKEVTDKNKINQELDFTKVSLLKNQSNIQINIPILMEEQPQTCEGPTTENELLSALKISQICQKSVPNNKSPRNYGLIKVFYETFREEMKIPLCNSMTKSYQNGQLNT